MHYIDKRDHYRLDDTIQVSYRIVAPAATASSSPESHFELDNSFLMARDLYRLELESREILREVSAQNPGLGSFLNNLNQRIDRITRAVLGDEAPATPAAEWQARISEGGISFIVAELLPPGTCLALKMQFQPSLLGLVAFGEVRHCRLIADREDYIAGVQFTALDPDSRQLVQRHILHRQSEARRERIRADAGI